MTTLLKESHEAYLRHQISTSTLGKVYSDFFSMMKTCRATFYYSEGFNIQYEFFENNKFKVLIENNNKNEFIIFNFNYFEYEKNAYPLQAGFPYYEILLTENHTNEYFDDLKMKMSFYINKFSELEIERIEELNPKIEIITKYYLDNHIDLRKMSIVIREHLLLEKLNLFKSLIRLGVDPNQCWIITKEDKSLYFEKVFNEVISLGINVIKLENREGISSIVEGISRDIINKHVILLDDGGDLINSFSEISDNFNWDIKAIETTSKGIHNTRNIKNIEILDLATCSIKKSLSFEIALSCVLRFKQLFQHEKTKGEYCHVVGYGKLGQYVSQFLRALGMEVTISELNEKRRRLASSADFKTYKTVEKALEKREYKYIFGCAGRPIITEKELEYLDKNAVLITASSQDLSVVIKFMEGNYQKRNLDGIGTLYIDDKHNKYTVVAEGHAVNLYYSEGVSEKEYDLFTTLMLSSVVESFNRIDDKKTAPILDVEELCKFVVEI